MNSLQDILSFDWLSVKVDDKRQLTINRFAEILGQCWSALFLHIERLLRNGAIEIEGGYSTFPTLALMIDAGDHFICELLGAAKHFTALDIRSIRASSATSYLSQFESEAKHFIPMADRTHLSNLVIAGNEEVRDAAHRFNLQLDDRTVLMQPNKGDCYALSIDASVNTASILNCFLVNKRNKLVRAKRVQACLIGSAKLNEGELVEAFRRLVKITLEPVPYRNPKVPGMSLHFDEKDERRHISAELATIFLSPRHRETIIGRFLHQHPMVLVHAFGAVEEKHELTLPWLGSRLESDATNIRPDFLLKRQDGYWDILDLKTAAMRWSKITKGKPQRKRFIDYVYEGIAQLYSYRRYFDDPQNAEFAREKYLIQVNNPRLILIVGNRDNATADEISCAIQSHGDDIIVVDYDTLNAMYFLRHD